MALLKHEKHERSGRRHVSLFRTITTQARSLRRLVTRVLRWEATRPTGMPKYGYREIAEFRQWMQQRLMDPVQSLPNPSDFFRIGISGEFIGTQSDVLQYTMSSRDEQFL